MPSTTGSLSDATVIEIGTFLFAKTALGGPAISGSFFGAMRGDEDKLRCDDDYRGHFVMNGWTIAGRGNLVDLSSTAIRHRRSVLTDFDSRHGLSCRRAFAERLSSLQRP